MAGVEYELNIWVSQGTNLYGKETAFIHNHWKIKMGLNFKKTVILFVLRLIRLLENMFLTKNLSYYRKKTPLLDLDPNFQGLPFIFVLQTIFHFLSSSWSKLSYFIVCNFSGDSNQCLSNPFHTTFWMAKLVPFDVFYA